MANIFESYRTLTLTDNKVDGYIASERGDLSNRYTPLQNLDKSTGRGDFRSKDLQWDEFTPLQMDVLPEYDGSVNIIINDDRNDPKSINSGFSVTENNTYIVPEHYGNAVTNIYEEDTLKGDVGLFKLYNKIPTYTFNGIYENGSMKCGSYVFYFRLSDADGNVTNVIQESGIIQLHVGTPNTNKVRMGLENENSNKSVSFTLDNLDKTYDYVRVYFERTSTGEGGGAVTLYTMVDKNYPIINSSCNITITGSETLLESLTLQDIQMHYADIQTAKTQAICSNTLFLGNVSSHEENYDTLRKLSWRIIPIPCESPNLGTINQDYKFYGGCGYYDINNVHDYVGYWPDEIYRFGVVFIYSNNRVSKVFNIQGIDFTTLGENIDKPHVLKALYKDENEQNKEDKWWDYDPDDHIFKKKYLTNSMGVVRFPNKSMINGKDNYNIKSLGIQFDYSNIISELKQLNIVGLYFVRQKRIPTIYGQGVVIGLTGKDHGAIPVIQKDGNYVCKSFLQSNRLLGGSTFYVEGEVNNQALLMPDAELQSAIYNDLFSGQEYALFEVGVFEDTKSDGDHYYFTNATSESTLSSESVKLTTVPHNTKSITDGETYFSTQVGYASDALQVSDLNHIWNCTYPQDLTKSTSLIRGEWGFYVGMSPNKFRYGTIVNIKDNTWLTNPNKINQAFEERFNDFSYYSPISRYYNLSENGTVNCYGGDCFSSVFTHKMMNNFADPEYPTNTQIVDPKCWAKNFVVRSTAIRDGETFSNCSNASDGFWVDRNKDLTLKNGAPPFYNQIAEEVSIDVSAYPMSVNPSFNIDSLSTDEEIKDQKDKYEEVKTSQASEGTSDEMLVYQEDVIIGQTVSSTDYKTNSGTILRNIITGILLTPISSIVALGKQIHYKKCGISEEAAFKLLRLTPKEPFTVGIGLADALIKVRYNQEHNIVKRGKTNINRSDVNAVPTSQWVTFPICSSLNLALRDIEFSNVTEEATHNKKRAFYPLEGMNPDEHIVESEVINSAAKKSISTNRAPCITGIPYIKTEFFNRIYWSKPVISNLYIDNYRLIYEEQYVEYNKEFGSITKIVPFNGELLIVFQHGVGLCQINLTPQTDAEYSQYVPSTSVLTSTVTPIMPNNGSMWQDSILYIPEQYCVFGVDTVAKKIWQITPNHSYKIISDNRISKFLIDFIDLSEFDFTEYLGHINVKTHYNAFKQDVIFTFYKDKAIWEQLSEDQEKVIKEQLCKNLQVGALNLTIQTTEVKENTITVKYTFEKRGTKEGINKYYIRKGKVYDESNKVLDIKPQIKSWESGTTWSICYSLMLNAFVTFYDWYPLLSENIDSVMFSFDKNSVESVLNSDLSGYIHELTISTLDTRFVLYKNQPKRDIDPAFNNYISIYEVKTGQNLTGKDKILQLNDWNLNSDHIASCYIYSDEKGWEFINPFNCPDGQVDLTIYTKIGDYHAVSKKYLQDLGALDVEGKYINAFDKCPYYHLKNSSMKDTMKLWKHGEAGLYDNANRIKPTNWYGKQHEFNFEFVALDKSYAQKIWNNLKILTNRAEPSKLEYEVVGESFDWHEYKPIVQWINSQEEVSGDPDYWWKYVLKTSKIDDILKSYPDFPELYEEEKYGYSKRFIQKLPYLKMKLTDKKGSPERPIYLWDKESPKSFWEQYSSHPKNKYNFNCNETCLVEDIQLNEQRIRSEQLGNDIKKYGRVRGNMSYNGDQWNIEIRPIYFKWCYYNKKTDTLEFKTVEMRNRDKYIKIKVRYSGEDLALISDIQTLYEDSFT